MARTCVRKGFVKKAVSRTKLGETVRWYHYPNDTSEGRLRVRRRSLVVTRLVLARARAAPPCEGSTDQSRQFSTIEERTLLMFAETDHPGMQDVSRLALEAAARREELGGVLDQAHESMIDLLRTKAEPKQQ